ncbi:hypothetical protein [Parachlamydia sp. AcF125]|uniref:hypothetical protein n=1 Tax=Parachlamydia sp. AcF125 TaxID=2795736 RepID=UPI001BC9A258|nr:hypothetical protein [Parachlamydia sp. AcF125]MBS4168970.1 hypothetical protein [Parachlamydia sp. AcF125]
MKIYGDDSEFTHYTKERGVFGNNDVLKGNRKTVYRYKISFFGNSNRSESVEPTLYLHISKTAWSTFTGKVRKYCFHWRWKTAYLDQEDGSSPQKILVCTSVRQGELTGRLKKLMGRSWFITNLINRDCYDEIFGQEFLRLAGQNERRFTKIFHPLGKMVGLYKEGSSDLLCPIYRSRGLFSLFRYQVLKCWSNQWKEVVVQAGQVAERILIKKSDEAIISRAGLITCSNLINA